MAYLMNRTFWKSEPLEKSGPRTYRKSGPYAKIHYIGQKNPYDKLEVADFKYDKYFLNLISLKLYIIALIYMNMSSCAYILYVALLHQTCKIELLWKCLIKYYAYVVESKYALR